jgi:hypothetical protein
LENKGYTNVLPAPKSVLSSPLVEAVAVESELLSFPEPLLQPDVILPVTAITNAAKKILLIFDFIFMIIIFKIDLKFKVTDIF